MSKLAAAVTSPWQQTGNAVGESASRVVQNDRQALTNLNRVKDLSRGAASNLGFDANALRMSKEEEFTAGLGSLFG